MLRAPRVRRFYVRDSEADDQRAAGRACILQRLDHRLHRSFEQKIGYTGSEGGQGLAKLPQEVNKSSHSNAHLISYKGSNHEPNEGADEDATGNLPKRCV